LTVRRLLPLLLIAVFAGCSAGQGDKPLYADADQRIDESTTSGMSGQEQAVEVPSGTERLEIRADMTIDGMAGFELTDPDGNQVKEDGVMGDRDRRDYVWYAANDPKPGIWTLEIGVQGTARVTFGVYLDGAASAVEAGGNAGRSAESALPWGVVATGGIVALGGGAWFVPRLRYGLMRLLVAIPLFSRFEKDQVLEHERRESIYQFVRNNPGQSFSDLRRSLELSNGTLVHHLRILEMQGFVRRESDGFRTRFYIRGPIQERAPYLTRAQSIVQATVARIPGLNQKQLAQVLGWPRRTAGYQAQRLAERGGLRQVRTGREVQYYPRDGDPATLSPASS
jgi:DNA-binding transcriptional ArsR family regulator